MNKRWIYLLVVVAILIVAFFVYWTRRPAPQTAIDLVARFPDAEKRTTMASLHDGFNVVDVTIGSDTKRSIFAHPHSRIIWHVQVPEGAVLNAAVALMPHVWTLNGDGAQFRIGVSDGTRYEELFRQIVNPFYVEGDRRWIPVRLDLSAYEGEKVEVIFNTDPGQSGNAVNDAAVWGEPKILAAR